MVIYGPLYYVASKCRDSRIRSKAVEILLRSPRREGMWDGHVIGQFSRQIVAVEQTGLDSSKDDITCDQILESSRFSDVTLGFSDDGSRGRLYLGRFRHEADGEWVVVETEFNFIPTSWKNVIPATEEQRKGTPNPFIFSPAPEVKLRATFNTTDDLGLGLVRMSHNIPRQSSSLNGFPTPSAAEFEAVKRELIARRAAEARDRYRSPHSTDKLIVPIPIPHSMSYTEGLSQRAQRDRGSPDEKDYDEEA